MKTMLNLAAVTLLTTALLDPLLSSGLGRPLPWVRDLLFAGGGILCLYLLYRFRRRL